MGELWGVRAVDGRRVMAAQNREHAEAVRAMFDRLGWKLAKVEVVPWPGSCREHAKQVRVHPLTPMESE